MWGSWRPLNQILLRAPNKQYIDCRYVLNSPVPPKEWALCCKYAEVVMNVFISSHVQLEACFFTHAFWASLFPRSPYSTSTFMSSSNHNPDTPASSQSLASCQIKTFSPSAVNQSFQHAKFLWPFSTASLWTPDISIKPSDQTSPSHEDLSTFISRHLSRLQWKLYWNWDFLVISFLVGLSTNILLIDLNSVYR